MDFFGFLRRSSRAQPPRARENVPSAMPPQQATPPEVAHAQSDEAAPPALALSPPAPRDVRRLLFDAVASGDESRLHALCKEHEDLIVQHSAAWLEVPPEFRTSPELYEWYGNGLRAISQFCAKRMAHQTIGNDIDQVLGRAQTPPD